jgi:hypothetical protein
VEESSGGTYTQNVYAPGGAALALIQSQTLAEARIGLPDGGKAVYNASGLVSFWHPDWLGTTRLRSSPTRTILGDASTAPFGEMYNAAPGIGGGCTLDGGPIGCGTAYAMTGIGASAECPRGFCSGFGTNDQGQVAFVQFQPTITSVNNWSRLAPWISPLLSPEQMLDAFNAQSNAATTALEARAVSDTEIKNFIKVLNADFSQDTAEGKDPFQSDFKLEGGNFHFPNPWFSFGCLGGRCGEG